MPKGKQFNAAEKHFEKEKREWIRKIKEIESKNRKLLKDNYELEELIQTINKENLYLHEVNEELMKLKDVSNDDVKLLISTRKSVSQFETLFGNMINYL